MVPPSVRCGGAPSQHYNLPSNDWENNEGNGGDGGYLRVDIENIQDIYWPLPLLLAGLPTAPMQRELCGVSRIAL